MYKVNNASKQILETVWGQEAKEAIKGAKKIWLSKTIL